MAWHDRRANNVIQLLRKTNFGIRQFHTLTAPASGAAALSLQARAFLPTPRRVQAVSHDSPDAA